MYSYQHRYHAGNFADLHKHVVLLAIFEALQQKEAPFCVLDAFAGEGIYDLNSKEGQKNKEYLSGFGKAKKALVAPRFIKELLKIAGSYQVEDQTLMYPGSPAIIYSKFLIENHPRAYLQLRKHFGWRKQIHAHKRDSIEAINALVPFKGKRGLIFIDPSYELKEEYNTIAEIVASTYLKFSQGIYMIWYPLLRESRHLALLAELKRGFENTWQHELISGKNDLDGGMYGSGIIIINPPWQLGKIVQEDLKFLQQL